ncbi:hypothetical protein LRS74_33035 [Streptomyces sp. LX-29]|uniref:hypothetical protein n=1 Tax=Streptomyces sp. LX-29 TaxID=2900152 RepID=UPI00240CEA02|nr:hypothetical protein [Streptomyces sp. LX-29]WFB11993.1 hypothetical protein LRS74_33035 [Streptomyces sp. LX-29]
MVVHRPGQVVALDTTPLPVKVREAVFSNCHETRDEGVARLWPLGHRNLNVLGRSILHRLGPA